MKAQTSRRVQFSRGLTLHQAELGIPANHLRPGAIRRLVSPDRRDPGVVPDERPPQRDDLAFVAALLGVGIRKAAHREELSYSPDRRIRPDQLDLDPVPIGNLVAQGQGFGKLVTRVQVENVNSWLHLGQEMNQNTPFGTKRGRHRQTRSGIARRPSG